MSNHGDIEAYIAGLEVSLLSPDVRESADTVGELLAEDFVEFGSSGRIYNRQEVVDALSGEEVSAWDVADMTVRLVAEGVALVTYRTTRQGIGQGTPVNSLRSSVWRLIDGRWRMSFHQGKPMSPS